MQSDHPYFHPACCESTRVIDPRALLVISFTLDNRLVDAISGILADER
jgi:hypothetical protein